MKKLSIILSLGAFAFGYSQSVYYNDYQRSVNDVNWETVAANLLLSPQQKSDLFSLNNQYSDYNTWNSRYSGNPDQWRQERYSSIERIMGPEKYVKFKNKYYKGQNPVAVYNRSKPKHKQNQVKKYNTIQYKKSVKQTVTPSKYKTSQKGIRPHTTKGNSQKVSTPSSMRQAKGKK